MINTWSSTKSWSKVNKTHMWILTLTTQYAIKIWIEKLLSGLVKDVTDVVKWRDDSQRSVETVVDNNREKKNNISRLTHTSPYSKTTVKRFCFNETDDTTLIRHTPIPTFDVINLLLHRKSHYWWDHLIVYLNVTDNFSRSLHGLLFGI